MQLLSTVPQQLRSLNLLAGISTFCRKKKTKERKEMSLPLDKNVYFYCTCGPGSKCSSTKNALSTFLDGIATVLFKYPSHNKAFHFKASSTYFLLGRPEMGHLFLRCFLSPNGKGRTDCIPLRFGPSLHKRRLLVLRSENGSSETCPPCSLPGSHNMRLSVLFLHKFVIDICAPTSRETLWLRLIPILFIYRCSVRWQTLEVAPLFGQSSRWT